MVRPMLSDRCVSCMFVTLVYCGKTVGWIKMPLGTELGLGPGHIVLDRDPGTSTERGTAALHFRGLRKIIYNIHSWMREKAL